jgi:hypothetical protein
VIKIEINAENGADARKELINLLGLSSNQAVTISGADLPVQIERTTDTIIGDGEKTSAELIQEQPAAEEPKKKRRTQAEIKAEVLAANTGTEEPPASEVTAEETPAAEFPDLVDLQRICAILVRAGYKDKGIELIKKIGGADSSKDVAEAKRADVIAAMTTFAEENKIAL